MSFANWFDSADLQWVLVVTFIFTAIYHYMFRNWNHFKRHSIPHERGVPPFGTHYRRLLKMESYTETLKRIYYQYPDESFVGIHDIGGGVSYLIRDPDLVKEITTKRFDHFVDKIDAFDFDTDPLFGRMLTYLRGDDWRHIRSALTPLFTSSKFRSITLPTMIDAKEHFVNHLVSEVGAGDEIEVDMMDFCIRTVIDSFGRCTMGVETDAVVNKESELNKAFADILHHLMSLNGFKQYGIIYFPRVMKYVFGLTALNATGTAFFKRLISDVADEREKRNIEKSDILGMVVNARKIERDGNKETKKSYPTEVEMVAQCLVFYLSAITENNMLLNFIAQALADHPDIQDRARQEMVTIRKQLNGSELAAETLRDMKYMDMVISEALRMCPIAPNLRRRATKPYTLTNSNRASIQVRPGEAIWMPAHIIQHDEQYYPSPMQFDPERFNDENKNSIRSGTYAPFGLGPRDCIGCRYAVMEAKITFFYLLQKFRLLRSEKLPKAKNAVVLRKLKV